MMTKINHGSDIKLQFNTILGGRMFIAR